MAAGADHGPERGAGLVPTLAGVSVFLVLLLFAAHLLLHLHARTVVTGVAFDAAASVAGGAGGPDAVPGTERRARALLGRYGEEGRASFRWRFEDPDRDGAPDVVALTVRAPGPSLLPAPVGRALGLDAVEHTARVRVERLR